MKIKQLAKIGKYQLKTIELEIDKQYFFLSGNDNLVKSWIITKPKFLRNIKARLKYKLAFASDVIHCRKIYLAIDSTDCDHSRSTYAIKCKNRFHAEARINDIYDNAEGSTFIQRISKSDYEDFTCSHRDMALEAFEDGHPFTIYR